MRRRRLASALFAVMAIGGCRTAHPAGPAPTPSTPAAAAPQPAVRRTHENLNAVLWMQTAVEYRASTLQTYRLARLQLDAALQDPRWTAAIEQRDDPANLPPAVVLDLDETVLDNSPFQARQIADSTPEKGVGYNETVWRRWMAERKATLVPGALEFLEYARSRGVTPVYVTNRNVKDAENHDTGEIATRQVLNSLHVPVDESTDTVLMRGENGWESSDKGLRRAFAAERFRILLLVGDNLEDFISVSDKSVNGRDELASGYADRWGTKWIILPNPAYGSWEQALTLGVPAGDDAGALKKKFEALRLER